MHDLTNSRIPKISCYRSQVQNLAPAKRQQNKNLPDFSSRRETHATFGQFLYLIIKLTNSTKNSDMLKI